MNTQIARIVAVVLLGFAFSGTHLSAIDGLDNSFATGGVTALNLSDNDSVADMKIGASGEIYLMGSTGMGVVGNYFNNYEDYTNIYVARYLSDGTIDPTFGGIGGSKPGTVVTDIQLVSDMALGLVPMSDGTIVAFTTQDSGEQAQLVMLRYLENGLLDTSFGNLGKKFINIPAAGNSGAKVELVDDRFVVCWARYAARVELDGTLDPTFGSGGVVDFQSVTGIDSNLSQAEIVDGTMVCGIHDRHNAESILFQLDHSGALMPSFGVGGLLYFSTADFPHVEGVRFFVEDNWITLAVSNRIARMDFHGNLDRTFGVAGLVDLQKAGYVSDMVRQPYGLIALAFCFDGFSTEYAVARLESDGLLDTSFGNDNVSAWQGWLRTPSGIAASANKLLSYSNGKLVVTGSYYAQVAFINRNVSLFRTEAFGHTPDLPPVGDGSLQSPPDPTHGTEVGVLDDSLSGDQELFWEPANLDRYSDEELMMLEHWIMETTTIGR